MNKLYEQIKDIGTQMESMVKTEEKPELRQEISLLKTQTEGDNFILRSQNSSEEKGEVIVQQIANVDCQFSETQHVRLMISDSESYISEPKFRLF